MRETRPDISTHRFAWPVATALQYGLNKGSQYHQLLNWIMRRPIDTPDDWRNMKVLLIIDEAQGSYEYLSLWNDLIKGLSPGSSPLIALFSSYGSPSDEPLGTPSPTPTPIYFQLS